jgi:hypothetical protein
MGNKYNILENCLEKYDINISYNINEKFLRIQTGFAQLRTRSSVQNWWTQ